MEVLFLIFFLARLFCQMSIKSLFQNFPKKMAIRDQITGFANRRSSHVEEESLFSGIFMIWLMTVLWLFKNMWSNLFLFRVTSLIYVCMPLLHHFTLSSSTFTMRVLWDSALKNLIFLHLTIIFHIWRTPLLTNLVHSIPQKRKVLGLVVNGPLANSVSTCTNTT